MNIILKLNNKFISEFFFYLFLIFDNGCVLLFINFFEWIKFCMDEILKSKNSLTHFRLHEFNAMKMQSLFNYFVRMGIKVLLSCSPWHMYGQDFIHHDTSVKNINN